MRIVTSECFYRGARVGLLDSGLKFAGMTGDRSELTQTCKR